MTTMETTKCPRERELRGRGNERLELPMHDDSSAGPKLCECGCGQAAPIATMSKPKWGHVPGEPMRFVLGHNTRGRKMTEEARARQSARQRGEGNPRWSGGVHTDARGYIAVILPDDHPFAAMRDRRGRVYRHRLVVAAVLGRPLERGEEVHHVDLDRTNNDVGNLVLLSGREHKRIHALIRHGSDPYEATIRVLGERP